MPTGSRVVKPLPVAVGNALESESQMYVPSQEGVVSDLIYRLSRHLAGVANGVDAESGSVAT
jgi:hypothetical protein